jgi:hypothetical protein
VLTIRRYTVIFGLVIFGTGMGCRLEMVGTEGICAVLTFEWQKVYEKAGRVWALAADGQDLLITFRDSNRSRRWHGGRCWEEDGEKKGEERYIKRRLRVYENLLGARRTRIHELSYVVS